jgi:hypothetical protein
MTPTELRALELYVGERVPDSEVAQSTWDALPQETKDAYLELAGQE